MAKKFSLEYKEYLMSDEWQEKRLHIAKLRKYTCEKCKKIIKSGFHIHHKTYKHFGAEKDHELMFLCRNCHKIVHIKKNIKKAKSKKSKTITCKYCLSKIPHKKYLESYMTNCPFCSKYIGRPSSFINPYNKFMK